MIVRGCSEENDLMERASATGKFVINIETEMCKIENDFQFKVYVNDTIRFYLIKRAQSAGVARTFFGAHQCLFPSVHQSHREPGLHLAHRHHLPSSLFSPVNLSKKMGQPTTNCNRRQRWWAVTHILEFDFNTHINNSKTQSFYFGDSDVILLLMLVRQQISHTPETQAINRPSAFTDVDLCFKCFRYELVLPYDGNWGSKDKNGRWNGMVGMLVRGALLFNFPKSNEECARGRFAPLFILIAAASSNNRKFRKEMARHWERW
ncbi:hypothetical protein GQR58_003467 [Nymphon striatum]|nr:hypothetical protein GQR58_003467 [Nymphon striatum]